MEVEVKEGKGKGRGGERERRGRKRDKGAGRGGGSKGPSGWREAERQSPAGPTIQLRPGSLRKRRKCRWSALLSVLGSAVRVAVTATLRWRC